MAGVTDRPFRQLCKKMGAGLAVSEMVTSNSLLYGSEKTKRRANHEGEPGPIAARYMPGGMGHGAEGHMSGLSPGGARGVGGGGGGD